MGFYFTKYRREKVTGVTSPWTLFSLFSKDLLILEGERACRGGEGVEEEGTENLKQIWTLLFDVAEAHLGLFSSLYIYTCTHTSTTCFSVTRGAGHLVVWGTD